MTVFRKLLLLAGALAIGRLVRKASRHRGRTAFSRRARDATEGSENPVRPAGPGAMRDPPERWSETDERVDETFPASDPGARY